LEVEEEFEWYENAKSGLQFWVCDSLFAPFLRMNFCCVKSQWRRDVQISVTLGNDGIETLKSSSTDGDVPIIR
jgi:hypothetical protein